MPVKNENYRIALTLWKAFWTFVQTAIGVGAGVVAIDMPGTWEEMKVKWPVLIVPLVLAIWRAFENARKQLGWFDWPNLGANAAKVLLICALLATPACVSTTPAFGGKTKVDIEFIDDITESVDEATGVGIGQITTFAINVRAPAGVNIADIVNMHYDWEPEKGSIGVSKEGTLDTTAQAEMQKVVAELQTVMAQGVAQGAIEMAGPLISEYLGILATRPPEQQEAGIVDLLGILMSGLGGTK